MKCGKLKNDWKYILHPHQCLQTLTVMIIVKAGSIYESKKEKNSGISHYLEHMLFQGTQGKLTNSKDITSTIYQNGGMINASTSYDYTTYYVKINAEHLEVALSVLSNMFFNSRFSQIDLEKEKKIVIQENRKHDSQPLRILHRLNYENVFHNTSLERDIGGDEGDIRGFNRKQVLEYMQEHYCHAVVSLYGKIPGTEKNVIKLLQKYFGKKMNYLKSTKNKKYKADELKKQLVVGGKVKLLEKKLQESYLALSLPVCNVFQCEEKIACDLLGIILAGNMSSRLFIKLREKNQYCYSVNYGLNHYVIGGDLTIRCGTQKKYIKMVTESIIEELIDLEKNGVTKKELKEAIDFKVGEMVLESEDTQGMAFHLGYQYLILDKCYDLNKNIKEYKKMNVSKMNKFLKKIIDIAKINLAILY